MYSTIIGIDTHANKNQIYAINRNSGEFAQATLSGEVKSVCEWVVKQDFERPIHCVYESGPTGYVLARALQSIDISCSIAAVSKLPKRTDKKKNDEEDAKWLAQTYLSGAVKEVFIPHVSEQALRNLSALRGEIAKDLTKAKQRVTSFLLFCGVRYTAGKKRWTKVFIKWALNYEFEDRLDTFALREKLQAVLHLMSRLEAIEQEIYLAVCQNPALDKMMRRFMCICGIGPVSAFAVVCAVGDFTRFKNGASLASYFGLIPSEHSSGDKCLRGKITKQGNSHVRRLLMEAACTYSRPLKLPCADALDLSVPLNVRLKAVQCINRLLARRSHFAKRGKNANKAKCAIARELCEWMYYIAVM